jgi:hypothetical protein
MGMYWSVEDCGWRTAERAAVDALITPWSVRGVDPWSPPCPADAAEVLRMPPRAVVVPHQAGSADALLPT